MSRIDGFEPPIHAAALDRATFSANEYGRRPAVEDRYPLPELAVVVPTLNERLNIRPFLGLLEAALEGVAWEVIFVDDDSRDGTAAEVRAIARQDRRVRCIQRLGRRGLSTACIEGALACAAPYIAVMDADLQHDERLLPQMLNLLRTEAFDVVVGSRYVDGGGVGEWTRGRANISNFATRLSRIICKVAIADPMSGYFMMRREAFEGAMRNLSGQGFKILLDLLASSPEPLRVRELPFQFRQRRHGDSKLDTLVAWEFVTLLADKLVGHIVPVRFVLFALIGALGLVVHMGILRTALAMLGFGFPESQALATMVAIASNFFLNNLFTYRDQRLRGWKLARGFVSFALICGLGAIGNIGIASYIFAHDHRWWAAGAVGAAVGLVWNYSVSSVYTWKARS
ncbi:MAG: glycosyltransferase family 2 protein [Acetobacteraceae bacterium]|nr:glycosyltransferase family 2 protein [Acetobacteraceae bacterium]